VALGGEGGLEEAGGPKDARDHEANSKKNEERAGAFVHLRGC